LNRLKAPAIDGENFGPFKNGITLHAALLRCLWVAYCGAKDPADFSAGLTNWRIPSAQRIPFNRISPGLTPDGLRADVHSFLNRTGTALLDRTNGLIETQVAPWLRPLLAEDVEWLRRWRSAT